MSASQTLAKLERQCRELGVRLIYDELRGEGGLCRLRDSYIVVINRRAAVETRVKLLSEALLAVEQRPIVSESAQVLKCSSGQVADGQRTEAAESGQVAGQDSGQVVKRSSGRVTDDERTEAAESGQVAGQDSGQVVKRSSGRVTDDERTEAAEAEAAAVEQAVEEFAHRQ